MDDALVAMVIGVEEKGFPVGRQRLAVYCVAVVLRGDVTLGGAKVNARLVHPTIAVLHLVRLGTARQGQQLVTQTDAEDRFGWIKGEGPAHGGDGRLAHSGIARPVAEEDAVVGDLHDE